MKPGNQWNGYGILSYLDLSIPRDEQGNTSEQPLDTLSRTQQVVTQSMYYVRTQQTEKTLHLENPAVPFYPVPLIQIPV